MKNQKWIAENEKDAQEIVSKELGISLEVKRKHGQAQFPSKDREERVKDIQAAADFLLEINLIKTR